MKPLFWVGLVLLILGVLLRIILLLTLRAITFAANVGVLGHHVLLSGLVTLKTPTQPRRSYGKSLFTPMAKPDPSHRFRVGIRRPFGGGEPIANAARRI